jgi:hypothetical protein
MSKSNSSRGKQKPSKRNLQPRKPPACLRDERAEPDDDSDDEVRAPKPKKASSAEQPKRRSRKLADRARPKQGKRSRHEDEDEETERREARKAVRLAVSSPDEDEDEDEDEDDRDSPDGADDDEDEDEEDEDDEPRRFNKGARSRVLSEEEDEEEDNCDASRDEVPDETPDEEDDCAEDESRPQQPSGRRYDEEEDYRTPQQRLDDEIELRSRPDADRFSGYLARLRQRQKVGAQHGLVGVSTSLPQLDAATGGLQGLTILAGRTQSGKTSLAIQFCLAALERHPKLAVVYYLLDEMSADDLTDQLICHVAQVDYQPYVRGTLTDAERKRVEAATGYVRKDILTRMLTVAELLPDKEGLGLTRSIMNNHHAAQLLRHTGADRLLVVVDMFEDIPVPRVVNCDDPPHYLARVRQIEQDPGPWRLQQLLGLSAFSQAQCRGGWPILALTKLRKAIARGAEPTLDDLLGGVELGYKATQVFFLLPEHEVATAAPVVPVTLAGLKARHGQSFRLPLSFYHSQCRFEEAGVSGCGRDQKKRDPQRAGQEAASRVGGKKSAFDPLAGKRP